jgi:hypothetical protein
VDESGGVFGDVSFDLRVSGMEHVGLACENEALDWFRHFSMHFLGVLYHFGGADHIYRRLSVLRYSF